MGQTRRRRHFVHGGIQGSLVLRLLFQWVLFVALLCPVSLFLQYVLNPLQDSAEWRHQLHISLASYVLVSLCLLPVFVYDLILFSHRFTGPILRLQGLVRRLGREPVERVNLRKHDFWHDFASDVNALSDRMAALGAPATVTAQEALPPVEGESPAEGEAPAGAIVTLWSGDAGTPSGVAQG